MPEVIADTDDGHIAGPNNTWAGTRDANGGASVNVTDVTSNSFTAVSKFASRGGGSSFRVERSFMYFDTSGITGTVASANFKIIGSSGPSDGSVIAVKSNAFGGDGGTALSTADFDAIPGWTDGASQEGNVTKYSVAVTDGGTNWNDNGTNTFDATSDLLADMKNNNIVIVCFLDYTNDYLNVEPTSATTTNISARYANISTASQRPRIEYTLATGYSHDIMGLAAANIGKVNTVATANVGKISGT